jgi:hypothetical protein
VYSILYIQLITLLTHPNIGKGEKVNILDAFGHE